MALGKKSMEIHTENPLQVEKELKEQRKEQTKELLGVFGEMALKIARILIK